MKLNTLVCLFLLFSFLPATAQKKSLSLRHVVYSELSVSNPKYSRSMYLKESASYFQPLAYYPEIAWNNRRDTNRVKSIRFIPQFPFDLLFTYVFYPREFREDLVLRKLYRVGTFETEFTFARREKTRLTYLINAEAFYGNFLFHTFGDYFGQAGGGVCYTKGDHNAKLRLAFPLRFHNRSYFMISPSAEYAYQWREKLAVRLSYGYMLSQFKRMDQPVLPTITTSWIHLLRLSVAIY